MNYTIEKIKSVVVKFEKNYFSFLILIISIASNHKDFSLNIVDNLKKFFKNSLAPHELL